MRYRTLIVDPGNMLCMIIGMGQTQLTVSILFFHTINESTATKPISKIKLKLLVTSYFHFLIYNLMMSRVYSVFTKAMRLNLLPDLDNIFSL